MIYLFDRQKKLQKIIPKKHLLSATQTVELNGLYQLSVEVPLFYETKEGTQYNHKKNIEKAWFAGHYDRQKRFQLYKIHARKISVKNDDTKVIIADGVHIFFDEAKAMGNIHDRRFRDTDVKAPADAAFNSIGWYIKDYDVTDRADITFYRDSVANARSLIIEKFGVEFDYGLTFDGRKIISKDLYIKKRLGRWTGKRFAYGTNLLSLSQEEDESEVYTAAVGRGKGEESGEGHGPRIEFGDIEWSKDGITKPVGQNWIEIPSATAEYGFYEDGELKPRIAAEVIFENTENKKLIADSTYYWLLENCVPKAVWKTDVAKSSIHDLGDSVGVIYKKADIVKIARVHKMENNLLDDALSKITLGDYQHFKTDKRQQSIRAQIKRNHADNQSVITQMKNDFDARFDAQTTAINNAYQQALIDANANIQAAEVRMQEELDTQRQAMINNIEQAERDAIQTAEQNAEAKKQEVQSNLDSFKTVHQQLYDDVTADIIDIDEFLGDISNITLDERLQEMNLDFEDRIQNININTANMLQGTRFDEPGRINTDYLGVEVLTDQDINRIRLRDDTGAVSRFSFTETVKIEANTDYFVTIEYRTFTVPEIDYFAIETPSGYVRLNSPDTGKEGFNNLVTDGVWNQATIRLNEPVMLQGKLHIGTRPSGVNDGAWIDIRQPYMTNTSNRHWLPHPNDATQSIAQITRRITELEDGRTELITRSEYDFDTGQVDQTIRDIEERVDVSRNMIVDIENYDVIQNGSEVMQTVRGFNQKVWDTTQEIGANLIPMSANAWEDGSFWSNGSEATDSTTRMNLRMKDSIPLVVGERYTLSDNSAYVSAIESIGIHQWDDDGNYVGLSWAGRGGSRSFTAIAGNLRISLLARDGLFIHTRFIDHIDERIQIKLEKGATATPMMNAISHIEQLANEASIAVQSIAGGDVLTQSDLTITADYWQLGSKRVDGDTVASVLRGTPGSIDAIVDEMNLTGNLNVKGQIESISMSAVNANIAELRTNILKSNVITSDMIGSNVIRAEHIFVQNAMIEDIVNMNLFTDNVKAMSIDAIYADLRSVNSEIMTTNILKSNWIDVDTALIDRIVTTNFFADNATIKAANVRDLSAVTIDAVQANLTTIMNDMGRAEGGLSIRRPDGAYAISNGLLKNEYVVNAYNPNFMSQTSQGLSCFFTQGAWWVTSQKVQRDMGTSTKMNFNAYQFVHSARYLEIEIGFRRHQVGFHMNVDSFSTSPSFSGYDNYARYGGGSTEYHVMKIDLGVPDYKRKAFYLRFRLNDQGADADQLWIRILRVVQTDF